MLGGGRATCGGGGAGVCGGGIGGSYRVEDSIDGGLGKGGNVE